MALTKEQILSEAMALGPDEREALAEELLQSITQDQQADIDAAWLAEVRRREEALALGQAPSTPVPSSSVEEMIARVRARSRQ
jgi:putative addiction module component (TIGR02574 family)